MHHHKKAHKIITFIVLIILLSLSGISNATATSPEVYAPSCILMESETEKILYSKNANEKMYPASTTKVMTAILALEKCNLSDIVTVSHNAIFDVPVGYSNANLKEGEKLTVEDLLYALLIPSANDAAFALAEHISGTVEEFSNLMNQKAKEIGCKSTHFVNPNGIHSEDHYSTAYDLALMGKYAMQNDVFRKIVKTTKYTLPKTNKYDKDDRIFTTTNDLLKEGSSTYYQYATGAKTGYTDAASHCIIATATKDNTDLIVVILHDDKTEDGLNTRAIDCKNLFEYGFNQYSRQLIAAAGSIKKTIRVSGASLDTKKLDLILEKDAFAYLPNEFSASNMEENIILNENIKAPITQGTVLGTITFAANNYSIKGNLVASHDVNQHNITNLAIEIFLIIIVLIILSKIIKRRNKKNKDFEFYPKYK